MHRTYLTKYRDKNGEEMTSISNDGRTLSMVVRGVEFRGRDFDSLEAAGTLCMAHTHTIRRCHEELRITFDPVGREFHFEYWSHPFVKPGPWKRTCGESEGFATVERILLKRVRWLKKQPLGQRPQQPPTSDSPTSNPSAR